MELRHKTTSFLGQWLRVMLFFLAPIAMLNFAVDPFLIFQWPPTRFLIPYKQSDGIRTIKPELLAGHHWDTLMIGTSRVEMGLDPNDRAWRGDRVFNGGLASAHMTEILRMFEFAMDHEPPRRLIFCLSFFSFNEGGTTYGDYQQSRLNPNTDLIDYYAGNLVGEQATVNSFRAYRNYRQYDEQFNYTMQGLFTGIPTGHDDYRKIMEDTLEVYLQRWDYYDNYLYTGESLRKFETIVRRCYREDIELVLVMLPVHALMLQAVYESGNWAQFEQWKRDILETTRRVQREENSGQTVTIWDFTHFTGPRAEPFPPPGVQPPMKWYIDTSHFRPQLGSYVLHRILGREHPDGDVYPDFGVPLTPESIEEHLEDIRLAGEVYRAQNPEEVYFVQQQRFPDEEEAGRVPQAERIKEGGQMPLRPTLRER